MWDADFDNTCSEITSPQPTWEEVRQDEIETYRVGIGEKNSASPTQRLCAVPATTCTEFPSGFPVLRASSGAAGGDRFGDAEIDLLMRCRRPQHN